VIRETVARWHQHVKGAEGVLDDILDDDVVFYSPVVFTPQQGKAIAREYLTAAVAAFVGSADRTTSSPASAKRFRTTNR
jgi:esterase/lipase superfamily enzyme